MGVRKFSSKKLFDGYAWRDRSVLIMNEDGGVEKIVDEADAGDHVEYFDGIICPGFINAHCHIELSHMKSRIPKGTGLVDFVFKVVSERDASEDEIFESIKEAEREMRDTGIVAVGDICNNISTLKQKLQHNLLYYNFIETSGWAPGVADIRFEKSKLIYEEFLKHFKTTSMVPHAPYSVSEELWNKLLPGFKNKVITIHNQETAEENTFFEDGTGDLQRMYQLMKLDNSFFRPSNLTSLKTYFNKLSTSASVILVHNTFINEKDIEYIFEQNNGQQISFCICINANIFIEKRVPPIDILLKNKCAIILGTDSLASNEQLNILEEMKKIHKYFPGIEIIEMLKWATINGARALQMENKLGSFEKGKMPGVVFINNIIDGNITEKSTSSRLL